MPLSMMLGVSRPLICGCNRTHANSQTSVLLHGCNLVVMQGFKSLPRTLMKGWLVVSEGKGVLASRACFKSRAREPGPPLKSSFTVSELPLKTDETGSNLPFKPGITQLKLPLKADVIGSRLLLKPSVVASRLPLNSNVLGPRMLFKPASQGMGIMQVSGVQVFSCYMSTSGKPPEWPHKSNTTDDKSKVDNMDINSTDGRMDGSSDGKMESSGSEKVDSFSNRGMESFSSGRMDSTSDSKMDTYSSGKTDNSSNGRMERWISYLQEKRPEVYSLGQKISEKSVSLKNSIAATNIGETQSDKKPEDWNDILNRWYQQYQDFVGITDLKKAQDRVTELSETLLETQGRRRALQAETEVLQEKLVINHQRITKTEQYSQEHFTLFDQAREMNERLKIVRADFSQCERTERDTFTQLSAAIRDCHERERMQAEQSKYWSIIASVVSAAVASIITSVNNWVRIREIKDHVSTNNRSLLDGYKQMHQDVLEAVTSSEVIDNEPGKIVKNAAGASVLGVDDSGQDVSKESVSSGEGTSGSRLSTRQTIPGHHTVTLAPEELSQISRELMNEISEALAKDRDKLRELLVEQFEKVVTGLTGGGKLVREATEGAVLDLPTQDLGKIETGTTHELSKASDVTLETAQALGSAIALDSAIPGSSEEGKPILTSEYTYRHIASAMAVGAGIGTLATACIMKSLGGG